MTKTGERAAARRRTATDPASRRIGIARSCLAAWGDADARRTLLGAPILVVLLASTAHAQVAVRGEVVHTLAGAPLRPGVVIARDGKIEWVGPAGQARIPDGFRVLEAAMVTPGLIDAHSVVGLAGILNQRAGGDTQVEDQDQLELSDAIQPELRAVDAYNAREELVAWLRSFGVTTVHTGHGPGALSSGQTMIVKTRGSTVEEAVVEPLTMIAFTLGPGVSARYKSPGTRAKGVAMLRADLLKAQRYVEKQGAPDPAKRPDPDLKLDALAKVLRREVPALVTAQTATEIMTALRLREEFGFELVLDGAAEAYLVLDAIRAAGVPVILHPTMVRPGGELQNASFETAAKLRQAGIPFALQSGYESYVPKTRVVLFEAAIAAANGLGFDAALAAITLDAAKILGVDGRVGSLERGKDADLALFDGDPFEYASRVCGVVIEGVVVSEECR
jgi:imidazolonepropionase-like amidohydrolase